MKKRHYLLIILTALGIAYLQPVVQLIGGLVVIAGVAALIYSDMSAAGQQAFERRLTQLLQGLQGALKHKPAVAIDKGQPRSDATTTAIALEVGKGAKASPVKEKARR